MDRGDGAGHCFKLPCHRCTKQIHTALNSWSPSYLQAVSETEGCSSKEYLSSVRLIRIWERPKHIRRNVGGSHMFVLHRVF